MSNLAFNKPINLNPNPFGVTFYVSNTTNPTEDQGSPGTTAQGRTPKNPYTTIAAAIAASVSGRGDVIFIQRGTYTENLTVNRAGLTLIGAVPYGYPDHVVVTGRTVVTTTGVSFYNMEFFSNSGTFPSVRLGAKTDAAGTVASTWFENCSFASDGTTEPEAGLLALGADRTTVKNCYFVDNNIGILTTSNLNAWPDQTRIVGCEFAENTEADVTDGGLDGQFLNGFDSSLNMGVESDGVGSNFRLEGCTFNSGATAPTDFVHISAQAVSRGSIVDCRFVSAVHDTATITIPAGILYIVNMAEEGITGVYSGAIGTSGRPD